MLRPTWATARVTSAPTPGGGCAWRCPAGAGSSPARTGRAWGTIEDGQRRTRSTAPDGRPAGSRRRRGVASVSGADSDRRRLSTIFQRAMPGTAAPAPPGRVACPAQDPRQELPVAARPAVLAGGRDEVVRRELVEQLHVGHEAGPGEHALEQVVAEHRVLGHPVDHRRAERVDVVDPLAGEAALAEQVLVDVRDGGGVRVDAGARRRRSAGRPTPRAPPAGST